MNLAIAQNREEELKEQIDGFDTLGLEMDITEPYKITQNLTYLRARIHTNIHFQGQATS